MARSTWGDFSALPKRGLSKLNGTESLNELLLDLNSEGWHCAEPAKTHSPGQGQENAIVFVSNRASSSQAGLQPSCEEMPNRELV